MFKFAVIGRNFVVDWFLEAAKEFPELLFWGVYSRKEETAAEYAKKQNAKKIYTSISQMCKDTELDFVYIASPNIFHEEQALSLLNAGKHVLCEKPVTLSYNSLEKILYTAEKNNKIFMEAMVPLHMPAFEKIKELLPLIGDVRHIELSFCQYSSRYDLFKQNIYTNTFNPELGNGAFMDLGIYCVAFLIALFGYPHKICGAAQFLPQSIDASGVVAAAYKDKTAAITFSKVCGTASQSQIHGEKGCILIDKMSRPKKLTLVLNNQSPQIIDASPVIHEMAYEIKSFLKQINGEYLPFYNEVSKMCMKFCDKARLDMGIDFKPHN